MNEFTRNEILWAILMGWKMRRPLFTIRYILAIISDNRRNDTRGTLCDGC